MHSWSFSLSLPLSLSRLFFVYVCLTELPPNAANEPILIPKSCQSLHQPATSAINSSATDVMMPNPAIIHLPPMQQMDQDINMLNTNEGLSPKDQTLASVQVSPVFNETFFNNSSQIASPPTLLNMKEEESAPSPAELLEWDMLTSPGLSNMDWTANPNFGNFDLGDEGLTMDTNTNVTKNNSQLSQQEMMATDGGSGMRLTDMNCFAPGSFIMASAPGLQTPSMHGSESDLTALGITGDAGESVDPSVQMEMSEWLDMNMPFHQSSSSGINLNPVMQSSSSSDPILTPRTQQEVLDLFSINDPDFGPSVPSSMTWDKYTEQSTSS